MRCLCNVSPVVKLSTFPKTTAALDYEMVNSELFSSPLVVARSRHAELMIIVNRIAQGGECVKGRI